MSRTQWAVNLAAVETQGALRCHAHRCDAHNKEEGSQECEVLVPDIIARIKEPDGVPADAMHDLLALAQIAEAAAPGKVIDVIGSTLLGIAWDGCIEASCDEIGPEGARDDMVDLEPANGRMETILARVHRAQAHDLADKSIVRIVPVMFLDLADQRRKARIIMHGVYRSCA